MNISCIIETLTRPDLIEEPPPPDTLDLGGCWIDFRMQQALCNELIATITIISLYPSLIR